MTSQSRVVHCQEDPNDYLQVGQLDNPGIAHIHIVSEIGMVTLHKRQILELASYLAELGERMSNEI